MQAEKEGALFSETDVRNRIQGLESQRAELMKRLSEKDEELKQITRLKYELEKQAVFQAESQKKYEQSLSQAQDESNALRRANERLQKLNMDMEFKLSKQEAIVNGEQAQLIKDLTAKVAVLESELQQVNAHAEGEAINAKQMENSRAEEEYNRELLRQGERVNQ